MSESKSNPSIELTTEGHVAILTMSNPTTNTWTKDTLIDLKFLLYSNLILLEGKTPSLFADVAPLSDLV